MKSRTSRHETGGFSFAVHSVHSIALTMAETAIYVDS
jgi:hypothetical protein